VDVFRTQDPPELNVVVDLAGIDSEHVHLVVSDQTLVIAGTRPRPHHDCPGSYYHLEIQYGPFERRIGLPENVDAGHARASYEHGLLRIVLPELPDPVPAPRASIPVRRER
jgi:HSP20 family protein